VLSRFNARHVGRHEQADDATVLVTGLADVDLQLARLL
jgi:hypothetical protein